VGRALGRTRWAIPEGWLPAHSEGVGGRALHLRFNDLRDPEPIPVATDYASVLESDVPIVVQHTRLDARQAESALLSTIAWAAD
jgi:hypothetical protein